MPAIRQNAYLIPANTSALRVEPAYVKPLLQLRYNVNQPDRSKHIQAIAWPDALPKAAKTKDVDWQSEAQRLAVEFGTETFFRVYATDDAFKSAFDSCRASAHETEEQTVPDLAATDDILVDEYADLHVPTFTQDQAKLLVAAGVMVNMLPLVDQQAVAAKTGLPLNLIRSLVEAARSKLNSAPRGAPSAPSEMRPSEIKRPAESAITA